MENKLPIAQALSEIMKAVGGIAKKDRNQAQGFNFRGIDSVVNAGQNESFLESECVSCGACVQACPSHALVEKSLFEGEYQHV